MEATYIDLSSLKLVLPWVLRGSDTGSMGGRLISYGVRRRLLQSEGAPVMSVSRSALVGSVKMGCRGMRLLESTCWPATIIPKMYRIGNKREGSLTIQDSDMYHRG